MAEKRTPEDNRIIQLYLNRSEEAVRETQRLYGAYLHAIASGVLRDYQDAEECVNDTYLRAWDSIPKTEPDNLKAYLAKTVRNLAISRLRSNLARKRGGEAVVTSFEELSECIPDSRLKEEADRGQLKDLLEHFLRKLSREKRMIFLKRYWYNCSVTDIAAQLGKDEKYVSNKLYQLKKKLQKALREGRR